MPAKVLKSWSEFQSKVVDPFCKKERDKRADVWFRGQSDSTWPLLTTLDRWQTFPSNVERTELYKKLMTTFREEIVGVEASKSVPEGDALELLARHHGLPSTLLDWSRSPYVAAYFAFEESLQKKGAASTAIWACNCQKLIVGPEVDLIVDRSLLWYNRRALEQGGVFIRVNTISTSISDLLGDALIKYEIASSHAEVAMRYLEAMNITASTLFRDLDGAARAAKNRLLT